MGQGSRRLNSPTSFCLFLDIQLELQSSWITPRLLYRFNPRHQHQQQQFPSHENKSRSTQSFRIADVEQDAYRAA